MDQEILKSMPDYVKNLPKILQELIFESVWQKRTEEVAKKYSLNPTQTDTLIENVLLVLIGLDEPENFSELMSSEIGISKLLSTQILDDLGSRVFDYANKFVEDKTNTTSIASIPKVATTMVPSSEAQAKILSSTNSRILEIRPENLPAKTNAHVVTNIVPEKPKEPQKFVPPKYIPENKPVSTPEPQKVASAPEVKSPTPMAPVIHYTARENTEPVQQPVSVPRFTAVPITETPTIGVETPTTPIISANIIDSKLQTTINKPVTPTAPPTPQHKYPAVDPYREPLE